ncbi:MAG: TIM-barrel domain-containing protein, partial [Actinomycetota bacterium]
MDVSTDRHPGQPVDRVLRTSGDWILRSATVAATASNAVELDVVGLPAIELPGTPGWLTGESLVDQGIEVDMPNLPADLPLPELEPRPFRCTVEVVAPRTVRVTVAPAGARVFDEPPTWLGIVTEPATGTDVSVDPTGPEAGVTIEVGDDAARLATGDVRVEVGLHPFRLTVGDADEPVLRTSERLRQVAGFPMAPPIRFTEDGGGRARIVLELELEAHEEVLGFGEQFSRLVKNGQQLTLSTEDALGTGTGLAYKPAPVWHSTAGYLGFVNTGAGVEVDVGHERPSVMSLDVDDEALDLYITVSPSPTQRLADYTELTGRGRRPPLWAFGYWMGRCRYHRADEVLDVADEMRSRRIPLDVLHLDPDWLVVDRLNTDFIWNTERFGDAADFVDALRERGVRLSVWEVPYLDPESPRHAEAAEAGHLLQTTSGEIAQLRGTPTPDGRDRSLVDVTDPAARRWWQHLHTELLDAGVAVFKTDFGEGCPIDAAPRDGTPSHHLHNLYPLKYNAAVYEAIAEHSGHAPLVWGRSGWAGSHRYPGQWGGDAESTVAGLQATLRGGLSHALSTPGFWSHDIGGFFGPDLTPGLYVRWTQFGALSPLMRAHGLRPREPWEFGDEALDICRRWIRLRYSLLPYLWQVAGEVERCGLPMLRPLALEFPDDPFAAGIDDQFMLGRNLLVAPILDDRMRTVRRRIHLPPGRWHRLDTGPTDALSGSGDNSSEVADGPGVVWVDVPIDDMPVFVRDDATIPRVDVDESVRCVDDVVGRPWTLHHYGGDADG